jgi:hypothetical protein
MVKENSNKPAVEEKQEERLPKSHTLKSIPPDVYMIIQKEQADIKIKKGTNSFSFECTIYKLIRDYNKCRNSSPDFKPDPV